MVLLALMMMTGCGMFVRSPEVELTGIKITGLDRNGLQMELALAVNNPNPADLTLRGYRYDLQILSIPLTKGEIRKQIDFPAHAITNVSVPVVLPYRAVVDILQKQPDPDRIPYTLTSTFDLDSPLGSVAVPYGKSGTFAIPGKFRQTPLLNLLNGLLEGVRK
jgi:LEA14-like dessication related protein